MNPGLTLSTSLQQSTNLIVRKIPLRRLTLDLRLSSSPAISVYKFFLPTDCAKLFELLSSTELTQLELLALDLIPNPPARFKLRHLKILKLSGTCSLKETVISISFSLLTRKLLTQTALYRATSKPCSPSSILFLRSLTSTSSDLPSSVLLRLPMKCQDSKRCRSIFASPNSAFSSSTFDSRVSRPSLTKVRAKTGK